MATRSVGVGVPVAPLIATVLLVLGAAAPHVADGASSRGGANLQRQQIAFLDEAGLGLMNGDGTNVRWVARRAGAREVGPFGGLAWSPDGTRVTALVQRIWGNPDDPSDFAEGGVLCDAYVVNIASQRWARVFAFASDNGGGCWTSLSWSPDGRRLALDDGGSLWVVGLDGGHPSSLRTSGAHEPAWSPDGLEIAYTKNFVDGVPRSEIRTIAPDGTGDRRLTAGDSPAWSPDGAQIAYLRAGDIWVINADGSGQHRVTRTPVDEIQPIWSPDGRRIAYVRAATRGHNSGSPYRVFTIRPDGRAAKQLTRGAGIDSQISWSPDGRTIVFNRAEEPQERGTVMAVDATGGHERRLHTGADPVWRPAAH